MKGLLIGMSKFDQTKFNPEYDWNLVGNPKLSTCNPKLAWPQSKPDYFDMLFNLNQIKTNPTRKSAI